MLSKNQTRYHRCQRMREKLGIDSRNDFKNLEYAAKKTIIWSCCCYFRSLHWTALHFQQAYNKAKEYKDMKELA